MTLPTVCVVVGALPLLMGAGELSCGSSPSGPGGAGGSGELPSSDGGALPGAGGAPGSGGTSGAAKPTVHAVIANLSATANTTAGPFESMGATVEMLPGSPRAIYWTAREASYPNSGRRLEIMIPSEPVSGASFPIGDYTSGGPLIALVTVVDDRVKDAKDSSYTATWCSGAGVSRMSSGGTLLIESVNGKHIVVTGQGANLGNCGSALAQGTFSVTSFRAEGDIDDYK